MRRWLLFAGVSVVSIAAVTALARRHAADSARCGGLVPMQTRCCAEGQREEGGRCVGRPTRCPPRFELTDGGCVAPGDRVVVAGGQLRVGGSDWEAEGRIRAHEAVIAPFAMDSIEITEGSYALCSAAGRCPEVEGSGEPGRARGRISRAEAEAYCAFRGGRLPTDDEWTFAAAGPASRRYPWGDTGAVCRRAVWGLTDGPCGFGHVGPELAALHAEGATPQGIFDLAGNVSEWVASAAADVEGTVRGGSFAAQLATDLRTWKAVEKPANARSAETGARCAYDLAAP